MAVFSDLSEQYDALWKAIIRPPRDCYDLQELGPEVFRIEGKVYHRTDFTLVNHRGLHLVCSHFEPIPAQRPAERLPCVVYLHGNSGSRLEATMTLPVLLPCGITVFCFDFTGSGLSEGEYVSLGYFERDDVDVVVQHLRASNRVTCIGLWGRSMGAATALLHAHRDPSIAGLVLDSPFTDLRVLAEELVQEATSGWVPSWVVRIALHFVQGSIQKEAGFDINDLVPVAHVGQAFIPALFVTGQDDTFIRPHHTQQLHDAYAGDKNLILVEGGHNTPRPQFFLDSAGIFLFHTLQCAGILQPRAI